MSYTLNVFTGKFESTLNYTEIEAFGFVPYTGATLDVNLGDHTLTCGGTASGQSLIASGLVVNEAGGNLAQDDFRAETVSNANAFVVDASADTVTSNVKLISTEGRIVGTTRVTTTYTVLTTDHVVFADTDGGAFTITLPAGVEGQHFRITNCGSAGLALTIDGDGTETVLGELTQELSDGDTLNMYYNATEGWW